MKPNNVKLNHDRDLALWKWTANKRFTIKSVYEHLTRYDSDQNYKRILKDKIPEKIKIFMWPVERQAILIKDNIIKRRWKGDLGSFFYGAFETPDHLLFTCPIAKVVWGFSSYFLSPKN
jgi:hypothetical protein